jgi:putative CocE/NonD family hydrolase
MRAVIVERGVMVPMRDGVRLAADVFRPAEPQAPVLLSRTPYGRHLLEQLHAPDRLVEAGFAVVLQDCRGRFDSEGEWRPIEVETDDGHDTVEWAAAQPWSDGRVGMFGASYMGYTQWHAAIARPPHLVAILPETACVDYWDIAYGPGGAYRLGNRLGWAMSVAADSARRMGIEDPLLAAIAAAREAMPTADLAERARRLGAIVDPLLEARPLTSVTRFERTVPWYFDWLAHERRDDPYWLALSPSSRFPQIGLPMIHVGGWYDIMLGTTFRAYLGMRANAATDEARRHQRLIVGPWPHWTPDSPIVGQADFGPAARLDVTALRTEWFGHWLQGKPAPLLDDPPIRLFVMGQNIWRDEWEWPLARTRFEPWHLGAGGRLGPALPAADEEPDRFVYDPRDPVPTRGGRTLGVTGAAAGVFDQRDLEQRPDVLVYRSEPLREPLELTGPVVMDLWASTDAPDTDFTAKLVECRADGSVLNLCDGIVRARAAVPTPLAPGAAYRFTVDLVATSVLIAPGSRLGVHVSSSSFPMFEPNPNTGNPVGTDGHDDLRPARQAVYHDRMHPSRIVLPVVPR